MTKERSLDRIPLTRYAEVLAHVRHFSGHGLDEILARFAIPVEEWESAAAHWTPVLLAEAQDEPRSAVAAFGHAFGAARRRLKAERPALAEVGDAVPEPAPGPAEAPPEPVAEQSAAPSESADLESVALEAHYAPEVPTFLKPLSAPIPAAMRVPPAAKEGVFTETTEIDLARILGGNMPFDPTRPSPAAVPSVGPRAGTPLSGATMDIDSGAIARAALAFGSGRGPAQALPPTAELPDPTAAVMAPDRPPATEEASGSPRRRLVRFDPQTGKPLATPYWEQIPGWQRKDR